MIFSSKRSAQDNSTPATKMGFASFWQDARKSGQQYLATQHAESVESVVRDGNLEYTKETAGNESQPSYQEASGAPVEKESPLGYEINWFTVIFLNIGQMIGTGVFSTPGSILSGLGSVGLSLFFWFIGLLIAFAGFSTYLELASYFPNRSGAQVVYLEQAYPRPKYFFPTAYAMLNILLAFSSSNAIVLSTYTFRIAGTEPTEWQAKGVAIAGFTLATIVVIISNKWSLRFSNVIGVIKVLTLVFISITGFVVLGGRVKSIPDPGANFRDSFAGATGDASGVVRALVRVNYAYEGWSNSFNMVNEIKKPIKTIRWAGALSLAIVAVLYMLCNIAYFAAVPKQDVLESGTGVAALFFGAVFGPGNAARGLNFLVLLSSFGNLVSNLIGSSRIIRECGRQGVLPYPAFWASTQPFGTPLGPYAFKYVLTLLMVLAPPFGDAFDFLVDLKSYPDAVFAGCVAVGVFLIRRQRKRINAERPEFKTWDVVLLFYIAIQIILLVMPWVPPAGGINAGSVSFFYATYCFTGIGILAACGVYYWIWTHFLPRRGNYALRQTVIVLDSGAQTHKLNKVPNSELAEWDARHDVVGKEISSGSKVDSNTGSNEDEVIRQRVPDEKTNNYREV
ncbi:hypothetical protein VE01_06943 [Pseudogymnoascus verrucosus]|uniref:High-affinity methionine permease n=1 Tax=Pseudogymnoascus verrucosus TaxID=342668 RepID=A0A1B8GJX5_9PEZI|nr:uncharacterized protein VE01_06943 [Pseudogymnoascus verrucosus]OBT96141.2 hypothetical protein VE01_06943 [Pseudogymnoascus verrucosus]